MMKSLFVLAIQFILVFQVYAESGMTSIIGGRFRALNQTSTQYNGIHSAGGWLTTETDNQQVVSTSGCTVRYLRVLLDGTPGAGNSYAFDLRVNAASPADTCTCTISDTGTSCTDLTCSMSITTADKVAIRQIPTSTPTVRNVEWSAIVDCTTNRQQLILGGTNGDTAAATTAYTELQGSGQDMETADNLATQVVASAGTIKNLYVNTITAPGVGQTIDWTLMVNGSPSTLTCQLAGAGGTTCNDTSNTVTVAAGNTVSLRYVSSATAAVSSATAFGVLFIPTIEGESLWLGGDDSAPSATAVNFAPIYEGRAFNATETNVAALTQGNHTIKNLYVNINTDPANGAGVQSYAFAVMKNGSATSLNCTISEGSTTCNDTSNTVIYLDGDTISLRITPANTPTSSIPHWGVTSLMKRRYWSSR